MCLWSLPSSRGTFSGGRLAFPGRQALHSILRGAACGGAGVGLAMANGGPEVLAQLDARTSLTQRPVLPGPRLHGVASGVDFDLDLFPEGPVIIGRALFPEGVGAVVSRQRIRITGSGSSWRAWDVSSFGTQLEASGATRRLPTSEAEAVQIYDGDKLVTTADIFLVAAGLGPRPPPPPPFAPSGPPQPAVPHEDIKYITAVRDSIADLPWPWLRRRRLMTLSSSTRQSVAWSALCARRRAFGDVPCPRGPFVASTAWLAKSAGRLAPCAWAPFLSMRPGPCRSPCLRLTAKGKPYRRPR